ncbi:MAG: hypothetical protein AAF196_03000 [Planctomycetota bacterium]
MALIADRLPLDKLREIILAHEDAILRAAQRGHVESFSAAGESWNYRSPKDLAQSLEAMERIYNARLARQRGVKAFPVRFGRGARRW